MAAKKAVKRERKEEVVKMIKIIITTNQSRSESTIKFPNATRRMAEAARRAVYAMMVSD